MILDLWLIQLLVKVNFGKKVCQQIRLKVTNKAGSNLVVIEELILTSYSYRFKPIR